MSNLVLPNFPGRHWELKITDEFTNLISKAAAPGYDTRVSLGPDPIQHFELSYDFLRQPGSQADTLGDPVEELMEFRGFFRARQGDFDSFLLYLPDFTENPEDGTITDQVLTPDGNGIAPLIVTRGGFGENIYEAAGVNGDPLYPTGAAVPALTRGGSPLVAGTDYNIVGPGFTAGSTTYPGLAVQFITSGAGTIEATFWWFYRVRFEQGTQEVGKFLALLYEVQKMQLVQTRT